jgi:hypothetical protein
MPRRFRVPALALIPLVLASCSQELEAPKAPERTGLFTLDTALGPVDVLAFRDDPAGSREVRIHAVLPDGGHAVRTIHIALEPAAATGLASRIVQTVEAEGGERLRVLRTAEESGGFQAFEIGGERMRLAERRAESFSGVPRAGRSGAHLGAVAEPRRGRTRPRDGSRESLRAFYGKALPGARILRFWSRWRRADWAEHSEAPPDNAGRIPSPNAEFGRSA